MTTLKISELSVGDWVRWEVYDKTYDMQVSGVTDRRIYGLHDGIEYSMLLTQICSIPITAEILLKNGWENLRSGYKCSCGVYDIHIWIKEASVIVTIYELERILKAARMQVYSPDMSVHQLQHILRLAGVDKEINL